jgi:hypothetical protein
MTLLFPIDVDIDPGPVTGPLPFTICELWLIILPTLHFLLDFPLGFLLLMVFFYLFCN